MQGSCGECRFSAVVPAPKWAGLVECRRRPPLAGNRPVADWPQVHPDGWCGEFEAKVKPPVKKQAARPTSGDVETRGEQD